MNINTTNYETQNEVMYIHDSEILNLRMDYEHHLTKLLLGNSYLKKNFSFTFQNTVQILWGQICPYAEMFDIQNVDFSTVAVSDIFKMLHENGEICNSRFAACPNSLLLNTVFEFSSGDQLRIIAETVEFEEYEIEDRGRDKIKEDKSANKKSIGK